MYATFEYVTANTLLQEVKMELDLLDGTDADFLIRKYLKDAMGELRSIGVVSQKQAEVEICDLKAKLPCDFIRFNEPNGLRIDAGGGYWWYPRIVNGANWYATTSVYPTWAAASVQDGYVYLSSDLSDYGLDAQYLCFNYQAVLTDENGNLLVPLSHGRACRAYAKWRYAQTNYERFPADLRNDFKEEWKWCKLDAKATAAIPDAAKKQQIYRVVNSLF